MNPMTNVKNIKKLSEQDIRLGGKSSWHDQYKDSAWIFIGGLPYDLTEGDIICVFSQYGEIVNINLVRDKESGKQKGFCFLCYEDQRSTILAVDNLNSSKILGRTLRVDHVENYKAPKEGKKNPIDDETRQLREEGCAPLSNIAQASSTTSRVPPQPPLRAEELIVGGVRLPPRLPIGPVTTIKIESSPEPEVEVEVKKTKKTSKKDKSKKKSKKENKAKKSSKRKRKQSTSSDSSESSSSSDSESSDDDSRRKSKKKRR